MIYKCFNFTCSSKRKWFFRFLSLSVLLFTASLPSIATTQGNATHRQVGHKQLSHKQISHKQRAAPLLVKRGQRVLMIAEQGGVEARTYGIASRKGRKGELIKIKNEDSQREVIAVVIDNGVVRVAN